MSIKKRSLATLRGSLETPNCQVKSAQAVYDQASDFRTNGVVPAIEVLRAQVELQTEQQRLISYQSDVEKLKLRLARAIGLPDGHVDFLDALETTVAATLGASHGQGNTVSGQGLRSGSTPADTPNHYLHHVRDPSNSKGFRRTRKALPTRHASVNIRGCAAYRRRWCGADIRRWLGSPRAGRTG